MEKIDPDKKYSASLDEELKLILEEYRSGYIDVYTMLKLIDMTCRDFLEKNDE